MTIERLPRAGLRFGWLDYEDSWNQSGVDANWQWMDALLGGVVASVVNTLPVGPVKGSFYLMSSQAGATSGRLALWVVSLNEAGVETGAWDYLAPAAGMRIYSLADKYFLRFDGSEWKTDAPAHMAFFAPGGFVENELICKFLSPSALAFPLNFSGSAASCEVAPAADYQVTIKKNGGTVGSFKFLAGSKSASFSGTAFSLAVGDALTFHAPAVADAQFDSLSVTLVAARRS